MQFERNLNYDPASPLVTQKYTPLHNIVLDNDDRDAITAICDRIARVLRGVRYQPQNPVRFFAHAGLVLNGNAAPLLVISSGRSDMVGTFLRNANGQAQMSGWYAPPRTGRALYVLVQRREFDRYDAELRDRIPDYVGAARRIWLVGYDFGPGANVVGFGASRLAALLFARRFQNAHAWIVDDNVVFVAGFPQDGTAVLNRIDAAIPQAAVCCGFTGATIADFAWDNGNRGQPLGPNDPLPPPDPNGMVQQAVRWNLQNLGLLAVSPYFVNSNEDVSLVNHLRRARPDPVPVLMNTRFAVRKAAAWNDDAEDTRVAAAGRRARQRPPGASFASGARYSAQVDCCPKASDSRFRSFFRTAARGRQHRTGGFLGVLRVMPALRQLSRQVTMKP